MKDFIVQLQPYLLNLFINILTLAILFVKTKKSTLIKKLDDKIDWSKYEMELEGNVYNLSQFKIKRK